LYWDLHDVYNKSKLVPLLKNVKIDKLWLYDDVLCLAHQDKKKMKVFSYSLLTIDSTKINACLQLKKIETKERKKGV
jgi:hypothetical protein